MHALSAAAEILGAGAVITFIGVRLIECAHPPRGCFIDSGGLRQHVVELGAAAGTPIVLIHGAGCNLEDMRLALGERLAARHRVILIDRAGLGWSERKGRRGSSPAYQATVLCNVLEPIREVWIHDEAFAASRLSMMRIMARRMGVPFRLWVRCSRRANNEISHAPNHILLGALNVIDP